MDKTVIELFAGVGGFRVGLNNITSIDNEGHAIGNFEFVWANQWEPSTKTQHAFDCYNLRFPKEERNSNGVCHVRPHARVGLDHYELPVADKETSITSYTKQSFWFNKDFVEKMNKNNE